MALSPRCYDWCGVPLPVPPGKSAYRIKGEFYRHLGATITRVDAKSGGALMKAFQRDGLHGFHMQPFVSSMLYDNLPLPRMVMCIAEVMGKDVVDVTKKMGRNAGEAQMKGVYKKFLDDMTVQSFGSELKKLLAFFYDYGTCDVTYGADGKSMNVVRGGIPLAVVEWWCLVSIPFLQVPLEAHGAKALDTKWKVTVTDPTATVPLGTATWDLRWS